MKKRVVFTTGGKGGTGKTTLASSLAEWYQTNDIPCTLLDLDTENKTKGSLSHFFRDKAHKIDIHQRNGLDSFIDYADHAPGVILADMGSGSGRVGVICLQRLTVSKPSSFHDPDMSIAMVPLERISDKYGTLPHENPTQFACPKVAALLPHNLPQSVRPVAPKLPRWGKCGA